MKIKLKNAKNENLDVLPVKRAHSPKKNSEETESLKPQKSSLIYLLYFFVIVFVCIILALAARFFFTIKNSTFVTPSYSVMVLNESPFMIVVNTETKKLSIFDLQSKTAAKTSNSLLYRLPLDGTISVNDSGLSSKSFPKISFLIKTLLRPWEYKYEGMTSLDAVKLTQLALSIPKREIERFSISLSKEGEIEGITQDALYDIFKDPLIINEQKSIEVVNATYTEGLAGSVGQLVKNTGGNVVSVASSSNTKRSRLVAAEQSKTLVRLSHILGIDSVIDENFSSISDIQIVLGEDFAARMR